MVERYDFSVAGCTGNSEFGCSACMNTDPDGDYVLASDYAALEAERDELKRRCEAMMAQIAGYNEDEMGRVFSVDSVKCPYCKNTTPISEEGGCPEEIISNFDHPRGNGECCHCEKTFYYEFEYLILADAMTMEYDGTPITEGRDNG